MTSEFRSWDWNFGKTPKFTVTRTLKVADHDGKMHHVNLHVEIQKGIVEEVKINLADGLSSVDLDEDASVINNFCGARYNHKIIENIIAAINCKTVTLRTQVEDKSDVVVTQ